jgi:hypothetical protein
MQVAGVGKGIATEIIKVLNSDYFEWNN